MRISSLLFASILLGSTLWAQDDESPYYVQFGGGVVLTPDADDVPGGSIGFDPGFSASLALGRRLTSDEDMSIDGEIELFYQAFKVDEDDLSAIASAVEDDAKTFAIMLNGVAHWHLTDQYSLYGGLGLGWAEKIEYEAWDSGNLSTEDEDGGAFQAKLGFAYNLGGSYDVLIGYRFFKTTPIDIDDATGPSSEIDVEQHSFEAGFRWGL